MSNEQNRSDTVDLHLGKRLNEYPQYGLTSAPCELKFKGVREKLPTNYRAVLRNGELAAIVSKRYTLFANEEARNLASTAAKDMGFKLLKEYDARHGNVYYATYVSDPKAKTHQELAVLKGDTVNLGFAVHNSIDGTSAFGFDPFTYRAVCSNGVIIQRSNLGAINVRRHLGKVENFKADIMSRLADLVNELAEIGDFYRALPTIELNAEIAQAIADRRPTKYLPDYIIRRRGEREVRLQAKVDETRNLWTVYNDFTQAIWHNGDADIRSKAIYATNLHEALEPLVAKVRAKAHA